MIDPQAEVGKEIVKQVAKPVQDFIKAVVGEPAKELGAWATDKIREKRLIAQITIFQKAQKLVVDAGLRPKAINMKLLVPLIENASLEEDEDIVNMWANLLANAATSDGVKSSYTSLLKEIDANEARIMQFIYNQYIAKFGVNFKPTHEYAGNISGELIQNIFNLNNEDFEQAIDNLYRLRLLAPTASTLSFLDDPNTPFAHYSKKNIGITYFGYFFIKACNVVEKSEK